MAKFLKVHTLTGQHHVMPWIHAYVIEGENSSFVVDTGYTLSMARSVRGLADSLCKPIEGVFVTHGHPDHYTGLVEFRDIPKLSSPEVLGFCHREDAAKGLKSKGFLGDEYPDERVYPTEMINDGQIFNFAGVKEKHTDTGPGESDSDSTFVFEHDGVTHAFLGDLVAPTHCFLRDGHTHAWLKTLERLGRELPDNTIIYQGHSTAPQTKSVIQFQHGYIKAYHKFIDSIKDRSLPPGDDIKNALVETLNKYVGKVDTENNSFLPTFMIDTYMAEIYEQRPYVGRKL